MTRKMGITEAVGDIQFDEGVNGFAEQGRTSNTGGTFIAALASHIETISLSKSGYRAGRAHMEYEPGQDAGNFGLHLTFTDRPEDAASSVSYQYGKRMYSKNGATLWLSDATYSTFGSGIVVSDVWIDNSVPAIKIKFVNLHSSASRTLDYYITWQVWQSDGRDS